MKEQAPKASLMEMSGLIQPGFGHLHTDVSSVGLIVSTVRHGRTRGKRIN